MRDYILIDDNRVILNVKKCEKCKAFRFQSQFEKNCNICDKCNF
jgi:acetyl-CoA carboxylase beta subunit